MKRRQGIFLLAACLCLSGCQAPDRGEQTEALKFAYISKDLNHYWFQQVAWGME